MSRHGGQQLAAFAVRGGAQAPLAARERLDPALTRAVDDDLAHSVRLLVSELVTNAVVHGGADDGASVRVRASLAAERLRAEVCHDGPAFTPPEDAPDLGTPGGLGLVLVDRVAEAWGIRNDGETCVWFEVVPQNRA